MQVKTVELLKAEDSIDSQKDSSQESKISSERQMAYSETSSQHTSLELSDAKIEDESFPGTDTQDDTDAKDKQASFYIGESSTNIITKSTTEKRHELAFDNKGYDDTLEDDGKARCEEIISEIIHETVEQKRHDYAIDEKGYEDRIDNSVEQKRQDYAIDTKGYEDTYDDSHVEQKRHDYAIDEKGYEDRFDDSVEQKRQDYAIDVKGYEETFDDSRDAKPYVLSVDIPEKPEEPTSVKPKTHPSKIPVKTVVLSKIEHDKTEQKIFRQDSETRNDILDQTETDKSEKMTAKIPSPPQQHAQEIVIEEKTTLQHPIPEHTYYEDQTAPMLQEAVREDVPIYTAEVLETHVIEEDSSHVVMKHMHSIEKVTSTKEGTSTEKYVKEKLDAKSSESKTHTHTESTTYVDDESKMEPKRFDSKEDEFAQKPTHKIESIEKHEERTVDEQTHATVINTFAILKTEQLKSEEKSDRIEKEGKKFEPKLELNLDKSELELSEKSFSKTTTKPEETISSTEQKIVLSPIKPFKGFTSFQESSEGFKSLLIDPSQVDQSMVDQTLAEVGESLDAVQEELIEVVKDGKLIKQSPSEFEFKVLPHITGTNDPIQESHQEEIITSAFDDFSKVYEQSDKQKTTTEVKISEPKSEDLVSLSSTDSSSKADVVHRTRKEHLKDPLNRWSVPDLDHSSSGDSHYQSFEKTESRPCSSDVENLLTYGNSSEYQTALDASLLPESTEYVSAVSTFDHSGKTISSHESMKSLDSESSANLGSIEVSEVSETLVPSITDPDIENETQDEDFDVDDNDMKLSSLEDQFCGVLMEEMPSQMKRSQEMTFQPEPSPIKVSPEAEDTQEIQPVQKFSSSIEDGKSFEEFKFASSLEDGSVLSMSLSSASYVDTVVENVEDLASSLGASSLAGVDFPALIRDDYASTSFEEPSKSEKIDSMMMTSSMGKDDETCYANTQITTVTVSSTTSEAGDSEPKRGKGHKRNESAAFGSADFLKDVCSAMGSESPVEEKEEEEEPILEVKERYQEEKKESESESDYDQYESEYSRAFKSPKVQKKSKDKHVETFEKDQEPEKRPFTPSQSVSEIIVEDATEEIETIKTEAETSRRPSQNMHDYSNIPDITITEDHQKYCEEDDDFQDNVLYKVKTQEELDKADDTPIHYAQEQQFTVAEDQYQELVQGPYEPNVADITTKYTPEEEEDKADSPDSFEMLEQPDISDEFVIIEEVAKEANEFDTEGKSISIKSIKYVKQHDDEVEQILVKSAPAAPNEGSAMYMREDLNFEFEESPPTDPEKEDSEAADAAAASKRWVEMQLSDNAAHLRYPYEMERGMLEDIKEEDTEFEVGSSRISSFKDSFSSTPEYDVLAGRKYFTREHDDVSMSSLQEFESLEQAISLENRRTHQGSQDSLSNGSFTRRYMLRSGAQGDDISLSSLKEFEGLENACIEAHLIEIKAKEEAAQLSRSDESNKSNGDGKSSSVKVTTVTTVASTVSQPKSCDKLPTKTQQDMEALLKAKLDECDEEISNVMEVSTDSLELGLKKSKSQNGNGGLGKDDSQLGSCDSLEINKSGDIMTSSIDSFEISKDVTARSSRSDVDSLEQQILQDVRRDSIDSIELEYSLQVTKMDRDSLEENLKSQPTSSSTTTTTTVIQGPVHTITRVVTTSSTTTTKQEMIKDMSNDSLNLNQTDPDQLLSSTGSLDHTSSTATNATYQNENDSQMSGSMTSCGSNTMIDTLESSFPDMMYQGATSSQFLFEEAKQQVRQHTKEGEKRYEYFEIFDKDFDKLDTIETESAGEEYNRDQPKQEEQKK